MISTIVLCVLLLVGLLTPLASMATVGVNLANHIVAFPPADLHQALSLWKPLEVLLDCVALALLGPGAYSSDARFFGRRKVIIPEIRRPLQP